MLIWIEGGFNLGFARPARNNSIIVLLRNELLYIQNNTRTYATDYSSKVES